MHFQRKLSGLASEVIRHVPYGSKFGIPLSEHHVHHVVPDLCDFRASRVSGPHVEGEISRWEVSIDLTISGATFR